MQSREPKKQTDIYLCCTKCQQQINYLVFQIHKHRCRSKLNQTIYENYDESKLQKSVLKQNKKLKQSSIKILKSEIFKIQQYNNQNQQPIICANCGQIIGLQQLEGHQKKCKFPVVKCEYCNVDYYCQIIDQHEKVCVDKIQLQKLRQQQKLEQQQQQKEIKEMIKKLEIEKLENEIRNQQKQQQFELQQQKEQQSINFSHLMRQFAQKSQLKENGLSLKQIQSIKISNYKKKKNSQQQMCPICYCPFKVNQKIINLKCQHMFHAGCVKQWLKQSRRCPVCKRSAI